MAYESFLPESRELGVESFSTDDLLGCENVGSELAEEFVLNVNRVSTLMLMIVKILSPCCGSNEPSPH